MKLQFTHTHMQRQTVMAIRRRLRLNELRRPLKQKMNNLYYAVFMKFTATHQTGKEADNIKQKVFLFISQEYKPYQVQTSDHLKKTKQKKPKALYSFIEQYKINQKGFGNAPWNMNC